VLKEGGRGKGWGAGVAHRVGHGCVVRVRRSRGRYFVPGAVRVMDILFVVCAKTSSGALSGASSGASSGECVRYASGQQVESTLESGRRPESE